MWLVARCHVMSCDVIWCVFILCDAISCVVWCHMMHWDVMWWLLCDATPTCENGMVSSELHTRQAVHSDKLGIKTWPNHIDLRHIWNVSYNARSNKHHPPTSPNAAPATKNDTHHWLSSHMKRHLQCAEQQASPSNLTKYCACHAKLHSKIKEIFAENSWSVNSNAWPIRAWSEHDPTMIRAWTRHLAPARSPRLLFALRRRILYWKLKHFALRLSTQISPNTAPATKSDTPRSPNAAPATKSDTSR